ncbi:MAG: aldo/keto reductase, partial [Betaproteobacteria bacterium]|nr:aldo/keto reductase [Betaproteobacteria bacterium]
PLGKTGIKVSVICLGTMTFGEQNGQTESHEQLDAAVAAGVNFIDTAEMYPSPVRPETCGATESIIGEWLAKRKNRADVVLATKVSGPGVGWIRGGKNRLDKKNIFAAVDASLRRLKTDYIDLYQTHWPDRNTNFFGKPNYEHTPEEDATPLAETLAALKELADAGKIRAFGVSNETPWGMLEHFRLARESGLPRPHSVQNPYNLLNRSYEIGMAEISAREECGLLPYSPLAFGALSGKYLGGKRPSGARLTRWAQYYKRYTTAKAEAAVADYAVLAEKFGLTPAQLAVAFSVRQPFITSSIIGATTMAQLKENIAAGEIVLDKECRAELESLGAKHFNPCP